MTSKYSGLTARGSKPSLDFLLRARDAASRGCTGWWRDFDLHVGASDEWVSAYTASALAASGDGRGRTAAEEIWKALASRAAGRDPGFGYNGKTTRDADSTAWACHLAQTLGVQGSAQREALAFLEVCQQADGGVATYASAEAVRKAIRIPIEMPVNGWASSHVCVTAAAGRVLGGAAKERACRFLRSKQGPEGRWQGYWWLDDEYATAFSVGCLADSEDEEDRAAAGRGVAWLQRSGGESAFALALRILGTCFGGARVPEGLITALLARQEEDGSWPSSARLRIPFPYETQPAQFWAWNRASKEFGGVRLDEGRIFTTATAIWALGTALEAQA
jgi:squalene-hopene/tetraprenyl-beta-curcumene cyclase